MSNDVTVHPVDKANDFVGIKIENNKIDIFVPQMFKCEKNGNILYKDLLLFLKSINISNSKGITDIKNSEDSDGNAWPIDSFLWMIYDFVENGYYYNRERCYSNQANGKIDWKRTMKSQPLYSDGNIIYDKLVTSKLSPINGIIAHIYKVCLLHSVKKIGWALNFNMHIELNQTMSNKFMIQYVKKEQGSTFDDIKRLRYKHMLKILNSAKESNIASNKYTFGINNYYYVFEVMVDKFFCGISGEEKKRYNPMGYWCLEGESEISSSNLRPDTIYKRCINNEIETYIIDAKMYQYGYTLSSNDLPKTSSMQKQITYGDFVHNYVDEKSKIRNIFILPCDKTKFINKKTIKFNNEGNLAYIGSAHVNYTNRRKPKEYDNIYSFIIDLNFLIKNYKKKDTKYINELCSTIQAKLDVGIK